MIGVHDQGEATGLPTAELLSSISLIRYMANRIGASSKVNKFVQGSQGLWAQVDIVKHYNPNNPHNPSQGFTDCCEDIRVCLVGNEDSGKSTFVTSSP